MNNTHKLSAEIKKTIKKYIKHKIDKGEYSISAENSIHSREIQLGFVEIVHYPDTTLIKLDVNKVSEDEFKQLFEGYEDLAKEAIDRINETYPIRYNKKTKK